MVSGKAAALMRSLAGAGSVRFRLEPGQAAQESCDMIRQAYDATARSEDFQTRIRVHAVYRHEFDCCQIMRLDIGPGSGLVAGRESGSWCCCDGRLSVGSRVDSGSTLPTPTHFYTPFVDIPA